MCKLSEKYNYSKTISAFFSLRRIIHRKKYTLLIHIKTVAIIEEKYISHISNIEMYFALASFFRKVKKIHLIIGKCSEVETN